ncbi:MAG TPA: YkgJ family cysteine cluster protein [Planctomycetaceae bacterium]
MSQCATCHAGCCRSYVVPLTGADVVRIMTQQQVSFWDFVCRWADPQGTIALKYAPHFCFRDTPEIPYVISLIKEPSSNFPQTTRCKFLTEGAPTAEHPLGISQCGIYGSRPGACRVFPTKFDRAGELAVLCDVPAQGQAGSDPVYRLCSRPWEPRDLDPIQQVQHLVVAKYEMDFFFKLARSWNARPGDWQLFPEFLKLVYANRVLPKDRPAEAALEGESPTILPFQRRAA